MVLLLKANQEAQLFKELIMAKKETPAPTQADFDKAWDNIHKGKGRLPEENDMGPLPTKEEADKNKDAMGKAMLKGATEGMGGKALGMKKGGKVKCMAKGGMTASKRADGCATKGKTKGRII